MYQCSIHFTCFTTSSLFASSKLLSSEQIRHCILSDGSGLQTAWIFEHGVGMACMYLCGPVIEQTNRVTFLGKIFFACDLC